MKTRVTQMKVTAEGRFLDRLVKELRMEDWSRASKKVLGQRIIRNYLGTEQPGDTEPLEKMTDRQLFSREIFGEFHEIEGAKFRVEQSVKFLRNLRPGRTRAETVSYHVEKHFEELYIFRERVIAWLRRLERLSRKRRLAGHTQWLRDIQGVVHRVLEGAVRVRSTHIHRGRFRDDDIERVGSLDLIVLVGGQHLFEPIRRAQTQRALKKWREVTAGNLQAVENMMSTLLDVLEPVIFDQLPPR
jgi:hypothetical protein